MLALTFPDGVALIFGGSGGIGRGVAEQFAQAGTAVAVCYNSKRDGPRRPFQSCMRWGEGERASGRRS